MSAVAVLVADGFETIECLTLVDVLRRGGVRVSLVSTMSTRDAVSSQQIEITCDCTLEEVDFDDYDYIVLPGGLPGATNLRRDERVCSLVRRLAYKKYMSPPILRRPLHTRRARASGRTPCHLLPRFR